MKPYTMKKLQSLTAPRKVNKLTINQIIASPYWQMLLASWLLVVGSRAYIPFYPVPMSLQTFTVALISLLFSCRISLGAIFLYVGYGVMHLPVFSSGAVGLAVLTGPTAGYAIGFFFMGGVISLLTERYPTSSQLQRLFFTLLGGAMVMGMGVLRLVPLMGWDLAMQVGLFPFLLSEPVKMIVATQVAGWIQQRNDQ
eukprot:gene142-191_t